MLYVFGWGVRNKFCGRVGRGADGGQHALTPLGRVAPAGLRHERHGAGAEAAPDARILRAGRHPPEGGAPRARQTGEVADPLRPLLHAGHARLRLREVLVRMFGSQAGLGDLADLGRGPRRGRRHRSPHGGRGPERRRRARRAVAAAPGQAPQEAVLSESCM